MKPEEQRIAIAEACGWNTKPEVMGSVFVYKDKEKCVHPMFPDYLNDLNAMHEAEKTLEVNRGAEQSRLNCYAELLQRISINARNHYTFQATAAQRAEAFLRTLGLWKE